MTLNPDRRSRQVRSPRPRATARAEGRKKFRRAARYGGDVYIRTGYAPVWLGRTLYTGAVYQVVRSARYDHVRTLGGAAISYRLSFDKRPHSTADDLAASAIPLTPEEVAHEAALHRRWSQAEAHFKQWEARRVRPPKPPQVRSLIG